MPRPGAGIVIIVASFATVACATGPGPGLFATAPGPEMRLQAEEDAEGAQHRFLASARTGTPAHELTRLLAESVSLTSSELGIVTGRSAVAGALATLLAEQGPEGRIERVEAATCVDESVLDGRLVGGTAGRRVSVRLRAYGEGGWRVQEIRLLPRHVSVTEIDERCDRYRAREAFGRSPTALSLTFDPLFLYETATADQGVLSLRGKSTRLEARIARRVAGPVWLEVTAARAVAPGHPPATDAARLDRQEETLGLVATYAVGLVRIGGGPVFARRDWDLHHPGTFGERFVRWRTTDVGLAAELAASYPLRGGWFAEGRGSLHYFRPTLVEPFAQYPAEEIGMTRAGVQVGAGYRF